MPSSRHWHRDAPRLRQAWTASAARVARAVWAQNSGSIARFASAMVRATIVAMRQNVTDQTGGLPGVECHRVYVACHAYQRYGVLVTQVRGVFGVPRNDVALARPGRRRGGRLLPRRTVCCCAGTGVGRSASRRRSSRCTGPLRLVRRRHGAGRCRGYALRRRSRGAGTLHRPLPVPGGRWP